MPSLNWVIGFDMDGDATLLAQIINDNGEHIRYAAMNELQQMLDTVEFFKRDSIPEGCGICLTCGAECDEEGICLEHPDSGEPDDDEDEDYNKCRVCGEQYDDGGDGYDGKCPECADKAENVGECNECGRDGVRLGLMGACEGGCEAVADEDDEVQP